MKASNLRKHLRFLKNPMGLGPLIDSDAVKFYLFIVNA